MREVEGPRIRRQTKNPSRRISMMRTLDMNHNDNPSLGNPRPQQPSEAAIAIIATAIILLTFLFVAALS
jgi:hypothetical protein